LRERQGSGREDAGAEVAVALAEAARTLDAQRTTDDTLDTVVRIAVEAVPGFDQAGVSVITRKGTVETLAATDDLVRRLDTLQRQVGEGPSFDALGAHPVVQVEHARHDQRWPRYLPGALREGLRAQLSLRLFSDRSTVGTLSFYSTSRDTIDADAPRIAELFAVHAAVALGAAREIEGLHEALHTRKTIGQAIGIVMERYRLDEDRAFSFLLRASQQANIKLRDIAADLVRGGPAEDGT
jgi:transcriptional regulator with GAF, ATPase, and Fis domain